MTNAEKLVVLSRLNVVKQQIREEPRLFTMDHWMVPGVRRENVLTCGTAHCIGGNLVHNEYPDYVVFEEQSRVTRLKGPKGDIIDFGEEAYHLLGIDRSERGNKGWIFFLDHWPFLLYSRYEKSWHPKQRAEIACEAIDMWAEENLMPDPDEELS